MTEISKTVSEQTIALKLAELSGKTGLLVRLPDSAAMNVLFAELEKYDLQERAETFNFLKRALNETRSSLGAESAYRED